MAKRNDRTGQTFGDLTILKQEMRNRESPGAKRAKPVNYSLCRCNKCGTEKWIRTDGIVSGSVTTCGCQKTALSARVGEKHGALTIIDVKKEGSKAMALCHCDKCGNDKWLTLQWVIGGKCTSCGCDKKKNIKGQMFGHLEAIEPTSNRYYGSVVWLFKCHNCGSYKRIPLSMVMQHNIRDCGCLTTEKRRKSGDESYKKGLKPSYVYNTGIYKIIDPKPRKGSRTGLCGISFTSSGRYRARIHFQKKEYYLGIYDDVNDAIDARKTAEDNLFNNFLKWYEETYPDEWSELKKEKQHKMHRLKKHNIDKLKRTGINLENTKEGESDNNEDDK